MKFAEINGYKIVLADHQNYYPDISFIAKSDNEVRFAVDFKTTYRLLNKQTHCNGFTLGSHGEYFINRTSNKNIQFPYGSYLGHFCIGIIYTRVFNKALDETNVLNLDSLDSITSVVKDFEFFVAEKWKIASDKSGSGNTANIGSIKHISDIINGRGTFSNLNESIFDDYWINYGKIIIYDVKSGKNKSIKSLKEFIQYRGIYPSKIRDRAIK